MKSCSYSTCPCVGPVSHWCAGEGSFCIFGFLFCYILISFLFVFCLKHSLLRYLVRVGSHLSLPVAKCLDWVPVASKKPSPGPIPVYETKRFLSRASYRFLHELTNRAHGILSGLSFRLTSNGVCIQSFRISQACRWRTYTSTSEKRPPEDQGACEVFDTPA